MKQRILPIDEVKTIYGKWAGSYDFSLLLFNLLGFRVTAYRKAAIKKLNLNHGDTVLDLGCGTGLNFELLKKEVGPAGSVIGIDLSEDMLLQAQKRVDKAGWKHVRLIHANIAEYSFPAVTDGVLSTLALTMSPEYNKIIQRASNVLQPDKRMSIFELKRPENWPNWLVQAMIKLLKSYGTRPEHTRRTPWRSIKEHFSQSNFEEFYFGAAYVATGIV